MAKITEEKQNKQGGVGAEPTSSVEKTKSVTLIESKESAEQLTHGERVRRGQIASVQKGRYGTGPAPYGYRRGGPGEKPLVVDDYEAEIVRMIFREYVRTKSTGKVVEYLHSKGIYTRQGKKWSRQAISIILSNRTYRGRVCFGGVEAEGLHDPIVDAALFYKANAIRQSRSRSKKNSEDK